MEGAVNRSRWRKRSPKNRPILLLSVFLLLLLLIFISSGHLRTLAGTLRSERFLDHHVAELRNALLMAAILNRTLIIPPVLDHHVVALGSCPKFRVANPADLRAVVWDHIMELFQDRRILFHSFTAYSNLINKSTLPQNSDNKLDSFQPDKELQRKKKISYIRKRRDVYKALGQGSKVEMSTVLAFGSLFSAPYRGSELYIDINEAASDPKIQSIVQQIEFLPFVPEIMTAGKEFALSNIKKPFLCAQLRLLDGQFKNHWKATFAALEQKLKSLELEQKENKFTSPMHIFIMTNIPLLNWTGTYLERLAKDVASYKLFTLQEKSELAIHLRCDIFFY